MLPLSEIAAVRDTVDAQWRSPVADAAAAPWGLRPGTALWWRSSAVHVWVVPPGRDPRGVLYLRAARAASPAGDRLVAGTAVQRRLAERGADVAALLPSSAGRLVEHVPSALGELVVVAVAAVDGQELDADDLDATRARAWGEALDALHAAAAPDDGDVPAPPSPFAPLLDAADAEVARAARALERAAAATEPSPAVVGHGDFELDNVRWAGDRVVCFDLDEAGPTTLATDLAKATADVGDAALVAHVVAGCTARSGATVTDRQLALARAGLAARGLADAPRVLDRTAAEVPGLEELHATLVRAADDDRRVLLESAQALAG